MTSRWNTKRQAADDGAVLSLDTWRPLPLIVALDMAAEIVRDHDGGSQSNPTGWKHDELLAVWLMLRAVVNELDAPGSPLAY